jgi:IS6 family transposase
MAAAAAKRFFQKALSSPNHPARWVLNVDRNPSYPAVIEALKSEATLQHRCRLRPVQYLNVAAVTLDSDPLLPGRSHVVEST